MKILSNASASSLVLVLALACSSPGHYGAALADGAPIQAVTLLHHPEQFDGQMLIVEADEAEVCPKKGCWMIVRDGERSMRVTFKDYGFFVPLDSAGSSALMQGEFRVVDVPVAEARHYLEDAGKHEEALKITAPVRTLTFVASGVELRRE